MPEEWKEPSLLTLVSSDGSAAQMRVDGHVFCVFEEDGLVHVVVAPIRARQRVTPSALAEKASIVRSPGSPATPAP